jgi:hypothetical protein
MRTLGWMVLCGVVAGTVGCAGSDSDSQMSGQRDVETMAASDGTVRSTGIHTWELGHSDTGTRVSGLGADGNALLELDAKLSEHGVTLVRRVFDDMGTERSHDETPYTFDGGVGTATQGLTRVATTQQAITISPAQLSASLNLDLGLSLDPSGGVIAISTKKTPCEKARNQFVRAQAALQAAADADNACSPTGGNPNCQAQAAAVNAAYDALQVAYQNYLAQCPNY